MELTLRKFGNSTALSFPPGLLRELGLKAGQALTLGKTKDGTLTLSPKRRYTLDELVAQCDMSAEQPADLAIWDEANPVGREVIQ